MVHDLIVFFAGATVGGVCGFLLCGILTIGKMADIQAGHGR